MNSTPPHDSSHIKYRDRPIADVVTGQMDVRGWQPGSDEVAGTDMLAVLDDGQNEEEDDGEEE